MKSFLNLFTNKTPVPYVGARESFSVANKTGTPGSQGLEAYGKIGTLHAIVSRLANATSQVEWHLYRKTTDGRRRYATVDGSDGRTEVTRNVVLDLLNKPNPWMPRQEFMETVQQHLDLIGEGWIVVTRVGGMPTELWPVRGDRMTVVKDADEFLVGYVYTGPDGRKTPLEPENVIQLRYPNPLDPYRGISPVQSIMVDLESDRYAAEWNRNFFKNSAIPGAVVELPDHMTDTEYYEFQDRWREAHQGVNNAHHIGIIDFGGKYIESKFAQRDMQFAELRGVSADAIRRAFSYPKPLLGDTDDVNLANAVAGEYVFSKYLIVSRLERWKAAFNNDLLAMFGANDLELDYDSPVPADRAADSQYLVAQANAAKTLIDAGFERSEVLKTVGLPPMEEREVVPPVQPDAKEVQDE